MTNRFPGCLSAVFALSLAMVVNSGAAAGDQPKPALNPAPALSPAPATQAAEIAGEIMNVTDVILKHHIDPPARQQMILDAIKGYFRAASVPAPDGLSARVSSIVTREQLTALLSEIWPRSPKPPVVGPAVVQAMVAGLLGSVPGDPELVSAKDQKVNEQIEGNRYVGIHIALGMDEKEKLPVIHQVLEGGPAYKAGVKTGDIIEKIEEIDTRDKGIRDAIDRIRGDEGTLVTIQVRQPGAKESRTYKIKRGTMPRSTVQGFRKLGAAGWDYRIDGSNPIAYVRIADFTASTAHELRKLAGQLESGGFRALILDLRESGGHSVHPVVLAADCLLDGGTIGRVRTTEGVRSFEADSESLFRGWPIVALVDRSTTGTTLWLAAALQDHRRAVIIGQTEAPRVVAGPPGPPPAAVERTTYPIGDGSWSISLVSGRLERGDGRPLGGDAIAPSARPRLVPPATSYSDETTVGLKPDHVVSRYPNVAAAVSARLGRQSPAEPDQARRLLDDPAVKKGVDLLRESLK